MCVIVVKPKDVKLKKIYWAECFRMNGHGAGLSYVEDNKLVVDKGYFDFDKLYAQIEKHEEKEMVVHFRISSAGPINPANCHPFRIDGTHFPKYSWAVSHNGTLDYKFSNTESDTNLFVSEILGPQLDMHPWFLNHAAGEHFLKMACKSKYTHGTDSKMVVFRYDSEAQESYIHITNKGLGVVEHGCWFSNTSFRLPMIYDGYRRHRGGYDIGDWEQEDAPFLASQEEFTSEKDWSKHGYHLHLGRWRPNRVRIPSRAKPSAVQTPLQIEQGRSEQQNNAAQPSASSGNKSIEVPRDSEIKANRNKEIRFNSRLDHLNKKGKKIMRNLACEYMKTQLDEEDYIKTGIHDRVMFFRDTVRHASASMEVTLMEDKVIDQYIVDAYWKCIAQPKLSIWDQIGLFSDEDAPPTPERADDGPDDIDEAVGAHERLGNNVEHFPLDAAHEDHVNI